jgi:uncharacterized C2H2 Zn-finger protein
MCHFNSVLFSMDKLHSCLLCPFSSESEESFSTHVIRYHKNDPGFVVRCSICQSTYRNYKSFSKHMNRKHSLDLVGDNALNDSSMQAQEAHDNMLRTPSISFQQEVRSKIAGLALKLKGKHNVSQAAINCVGENIEELVTSTKVYIGDALQRKIGTAKCV